MACPESVDIIILAALGELVWLHILQSDDGLRHDAPMPISAEALFATIVMAHANVMAYHVGHGARQKMWLVCVDVDTDADRFGGADRLRYGHARFAPLKCFTAEKIPTI